MRKATLKTCTALACGLLLLGCDRNTMKERGHIKPLQDSDFFADGKSSRGLLPGTVARSQYPSDVLDLTQRETPQTASFPFEITESVLQRGRQRYDIYCSVCHGYLGDGRGMVVQRGFTQPPSFHIPRLRDQEPDQHFYDVISNGWGAMYSYGDRVAPDDRWAIIAYIRALQLSQRISPELAAAVTPKPTQSSEK